MATTLQLVRADDFVTAGSALVLTDDTDGFDVRSWQTAIPGAEDDRVVEQFTMTVTGSSHDAVAANLQKLDLKARQTGEFKTGVDKLGIWLEVKAKNETNSRWALVTDMRRSTEGPYGFAFDQSNKLINFGLAIERTPYWESSSRNAYSSSPTTPSAINFLGGSFNYGSLSSVRGDVHARLAAVRFLGACSASIVEEMWIGFRSERFSAASGFKALWELELGRPSNDTALSTAEDSTSNPASGTGTNKMMRCTFGVSTIMQRRVNITVFEATGGTDEDEQFGQFHVLLRAKKTVSGDTIYVRLLDGFSGVTTYRTHDSVEITKTVWFLYHLGSVQIPSPGRPKLGVSEISEYELIIRAQRVSGGTGNLDMDCLCIVPYGDGLVYVSDGAVSGKNAEVTNTIVQAAANGLISAFSEIPGIYDGPRKSFPAQVIGGLPVGTGRAFVFGQSASQQMLKDSCEIRIDAVYRWLTMRGNQ